MKTLYITTGSNILVDAEDNTAKRMLYTPPGIDYIFLAEEPMHVAFTSGETHEEADVEKGDLIFTFYDDRKNRLIVIKNEKWVENILEQRKEEQDEKERWAQSILKNKNCCEEDCKKEG